MIVSLKDYAIETTPFLNRVVVTGNPAGLKGYGKMGLGPRIPLLEGEHGEQAEKIALELEKMMISSYIDSWIRGHLYLYACRYEFLPLHGCSCDVVPQDKQMYPLRADAVGHPIDPMTVSNGCAVLNPAWAAAPQEFFFGVSQDVLKLDGHVSRAFKVDQWAFKIELALHIPKGSVCVERRPRHQNN